MVRFRQFYRSALIILLCLAGFMAVGLVFPLLDLLYPIRSRGMRDKIKTAWVRAACAGLNITVDVIGQPIDKPGLIVSNHISWLDILALGSQGAFTFIAKREVARWPVFGFLAKRSGTLFMQRGNALKTRQTAEKMVWLLRQNERLILFPEGTTTTGDTVLRFHGRLYQAALFTGVKVQAAALAYQDEAREYAPFVGDAAFLPHLLQVFGLKRISITVKFCPPFMAKDMTRDTLARVTRVQVLEALGMTKADGQLNSNA